MTALEEQIRKLPKVQKIIIMEQIWADLSREEKSLSLPDWHVSELKETERRLEEGEEHFEDWSDAKRRLHAE